MKINRCILSLSIALYLFTAAEVFKALDKNALYIQVAAIFFCMFALNKNKKSLSILFLFFLLSLGFFYNFIISYNHLAAFESLIRYLIPLLLVLAFYSQNKSALEGVFICFVILNDLFQLLIYISYFLFGWSFYEPRLEMGYLLRAEGIVGFFSTFGFINFCAYILVDINSEIRKKSYLKLFFAIFMILSFSLKLLFCFIVFNIFRSSSAGSILKGSISGAIIIVLIYLLAPHSIISDLFDLSATKFSYYLIDGGSARYESYRVMFESIFSGNLAGEGLGTFGGPASTKYNSPLYYLYNFNWFGLEGILSTTDTMYPHIIVELGLFFGCIYIYTCTIYPCNLKSNLSVAFVAAFLLDNLASFSMLNPIYFFSFILVSRTLYDFKTIEEYK